MIMTSWRQRYEEVTDSMRNRHGQVSAEQAVLYSFVIAGMVGMGFYLQRAAQGGMKSNSDSLGQQFSTESGWKSISKSASNQTGTTTKSASESGYVHAVGGADLPALTVKEPKLP